MSVIVGKGNASEIPEDAVRIGRSEALTIQWKLIYEWKPASDVWPYRHGIAALAGLTAVSSLLITNHYRRKLKLLHYGRLAMYLPTIIIPTLLVPLFHSKFVSEEILLQSSCPVCIQVRAVVIQSVGGLLYPLTLSPISGFMYSTVFGTYRIPLVKRENLGELCSLWKRLTSPLSNRLAWLWAAHAALAFTVTNMEASSMFKIHRLLLEKETQSRE